MKTYFCLVYTQTSLMCNTYRLKSVRIHYFQLFTGLFTLMKLHFDV